MSRKKDPALRSFFRGRAQSSESAIFRWLWDHHAAVEEALGKHKAGWASIVDALVAAGVAGKLGGAPTRTSAMKTWARVCREKEIQRTRSVAADRRRPNRSPRLSGPPPVVAPSAPVPAMTAPAVVPQMEAVLAPAPAPPAAVPEGEIELTPEARAEMERLEQTFAKADAWLGPRIGRRP